MRYEEDSDLDAIEHRKLFYAHFGAAVYLANTFEHGLAIALMYADFLSSVQDNLKKGQPFNRQKYEQDFDAFFDMQFSQTMGNLLKRLNELHEVGPELKEKIAKAKKRRDYVVHHFSRDYAAEILSFEGREKMIAELQEDQVLFKEVDNELQHAMQPVRKRLGINDAVMEEYGKTEQEKLLRETADRLMGR
jgi:flagellar basal body-associated protein FliL